MKKLLFLFTVLAMLVSCSKNIDIFRSRIVIKGKLPVASSLKGKASESKEVNSLSDAVSVLVFNSSNYSVFPVKNNSFSAEAYYGIASALSFLDTANRLIGCLSAGGLNVLPLVSLSDGENTLIDLSNLTLDGGMVIPANNPIGNGIGLNDEEVNWYKEIGAYYESISKNIDVDNDGVVDILVKKNIRISTLFHTDIGIYGLNDREPVIIDTSDIAINYYVRIEGGKATIPVNSEEVSLSGPLGDSYTDIVQERYALCPDGFIAIFKRTGLDNLAAFKKGDYTLDISGEEYSINYSNICPKYFLIVAAPKIHTNSAGEITSISLEYQKCDGSPVNPENFIFLVQVQLGIQNQNISLGAGLYSTPESNPNPEKYNFILDAPVPLENLERITICYQDLLGNEFDQSWDPE